MEHGYARHGPTLTASLQELHWRQPPKPMAMAIMQILILGVSAAVLAFPAMARFAKTENVIEFRHASFSVMQMHFFCLGNRVNDRVSSNAKTADHADIVQTLAPLPWPAFAAGTGQAKPAPNRPSGRSRANFPNLSNKLVVETVNRSSQDWRHGPAQGRFQGHFQPRHD